MKKFTMAMALILVSILSVPALSGTNPSNGASSDVVEIDKLEDVTVYLVGPRFIASRSELRKIDADPVPELVKIAADRKKKPFVRERAIKCMSLYRDVRVHEGFSKMLSRSPDRYFGLVVMAYLEAFGEDAVGAVKPFITHRSAKVRATVVRGLGIFGGQEGYDLLRERERTERDPQVQAQIRAYVQ